MTFLFLYKPRNCLKTRDFCVILYAEFEIYLREGKHDVCKSQFYKTSTRNVKNDETGQWEKRPFYTVDDAFPFGHGEKSVYLIERFIRLKPVEAMAIRWHMGGFDDAAKGGSFAISLAFDRYPLAVKLHMADLESTYLREKGTSDVR